MKKTDEVYLQDILEAIDKIDNFVIGMNLVDFEADEKTQFAVFHAFEIIGEAANKLSTEFLSQHPELPARQAVELRNILIHGYDLIRLDIVWKTIADHLPPLKRQIVDIIE
jgi:uncharacterized protein with HEPN domain